MKTKTERGVRAMKARMVIGAAARIISVILIVSIAAAAPCAADYVLWEYFKMGVTLEKGNQKYTYVNDTFSPSGIPSGAYVYLDQVGLEYTFALIAPYEPPDHITESGSFWYTVQITEYGFILEQALVESQGTWDYAGSVFTTLVEPDITLESVNGVASAPESIPGDRIALTVKNQLSFSSGGLDYVANKFTEGESQSGVPEPATAAGLAIAGLLMALRRMRKA